MRKYLSLLLALCLCALSLFGCAPASENSITVYNWEDYINPEVIDLFEEETGIQVNYVRFTTNEEMYIKLEKGGASYDVAFPSDYMIERMIQNDMLLPLDHEKLPNFTNNAQWLPGSRLRSRQPLLHALHVGNGRHPVQHHRHRGRDRLLGRHVGRKV